MSSSLTPGSGKSAAHLRITVSSRPSETLGTASSVGAVKRCPACTARRPARSDRQPPAWPPARPRPDGSERRRCRRSRAGPKGDMDGTQDLLVLQHVAGELRPVVRAHPNSARLVPARRGPPAAPGTRVQARRGLGDMAVAHVSTAGGSLSPSGAKLEATICPPVQRGDEPLATGQVPERTALGKTAIVGQATPIGEVQPEVRSPRAGHAGLQPGPELLPRPERAAINSKSTAITRASMSSVTSGHRGAARAAGRWPLASNRVAQRASRRRNEHVAALQRRCHGRCGFGSVHLALVHQRQHRVRAGRPRCLPEGLPELQQRWVGDHQHVLAWLDCQAVVDAPRGMDPDRPSGRIICASPSSSADTILSGTRITSKWRAHASVAHPRHLAAAIALGASVLTAAPSPSGPSAERTRLERKGFTITIEASKTKISPSPSPASEAPSPSGRPDPSPGS